MNDSRIEIGGQKEFMDAVWGVVSEGKKTAGALLLEAATDTHSNAVKSISGGSRAGKKYKATKAGKIHTASAPGEPPKTDTGALVSGITLEKEPYGYSVGSRPKAPHGFWLEFGTSKMDPRPWLRPAFDKMVDGFLRKYRG